MTEAEKLLTQLRDIHEPVPPDGIPTTVWWITAIIAGFIVLSIVVARRLHRKQPKPLSHIAHHCHLAEYEPTDMARLRLARLLRQQMTIVGAASDVTSATGDTWLKQLDTALNTNWFSDGDGRQFGDNLYRNHSQHLTKAHCDKVRELLEQATNA